MNSETKILMLVLFIYLFSGFVSAQPKAVVKPLSYNFGDIIQDSVVTTTFIIKNEGTDLLKIKSLKASCGCTAVVAGKSELMSGESTDIKVSFDSKGKSGKQKKIITIETNDPENSTIKLALTGNVIKKDLKIGKIERLKN